MKTLIYQNILGFWKIITNKLKIYILNAKNYQMTTSSK